MNEQTEDLPYVFLRPGELHFGMEPSVVGTILGSCLAVTLHCRRLAVGAICHAVLPYGQDRKNFRYLDRAIDHMVGEFFLVGASPVELDAKLFGGADMFDARFVGRGGPTVGRQNIRAAREILGDKGIGVSKEQLGGNQGRKLYFYPHTGEVLLKRLPHGGGAERALR